MTCEIWEENLNAFVDGELKGEEKEKTLLHLSQCPSCQKEKELLLLLKKGAASANHIPATPQSLGQEIISSLKSENFPPKRNPNPRPFKLTLIGGLGFAAAAAFLVLRSRLFPAPPPEPVSLNWILAAHNEYAMSLPLSQTELALPSFDKNSGKAGG
jgi:anti-sigma factor RsiW